MEKLINFAIALFKADGKIYVRTEREGGISAMHSVEEFVKKFEDSYEETISRGYSWQMSTLLNWMTYNFSIISVEDEEWLKTHILGPPPYRVMNMSHVSGFMAGIPAIETDEVKELFEKGAKPSLIKK